MTIPTDPYNSPQRRPFDEGHILAPLSEKAESVGSAQTAQSLEDSSSTDSPEQTASSNRPISSPQPTASAHSATQPSSSEGKIVFSQAKDVPGVKADVSSSEFATPLFKAAQETPSAWNADSASTASPASTSTFGTSSVFGTASDGSSTSSHSDSPSQTASSPQESTSSHPPATDPHQATTKPTALAEQGSAPPSSTLSSPHPTFSPNSPASSSPPPGSSSSHSVGSSTSNSLSSRSAVLGSPTAHTPAMPSTYVPSTAPTPSLTPDGASETTSAHTPKAPSRTAPGIAPAAAFGISSEETRENGRNATQEAAQTSEESPAALRESLAAGAGLGAFASPRVGEQLVPHIDPLAAVRPLATGRVSSQATSQTRTSTHSPVYSQASARSAVSNGSPAQSSSSQTASVSSITAPERHHPVRTSLRRALADVDTDGVPTTGGVASIFDNKLATVAFAPSRDIGGTYESTTSAGTLSAFGPDSVFGAESAFSADSAFGDSLNAQQATATISETPSSSAPAVPNARSNGEAQSAAANGDAKGTKREENSEGSPESAIPLPPKKRGPTHVGVLFATTLLVPSAWYVVSDAYARLSAAHAHSSISFAGAAELVGGLALIALIWFLARASSLGVTFTGWVVTAFGAFGLAFPRWTEKAILDPISARFGEINGLTENIANLLAHDMLTGLIFLFGGVLLLTGMVSHWARRRGHKYGVLVTRRTLALESLQEYENVYVPTPRA